MILGMRNMVTKLVDCQVDYIESDGESWINTLINPDKYIVADYEFSFVGYPPTTRVIYGSYYDRVKNPQIQVVLEQGEYFSPNANCVTTGAFNYESLLLHTRYHFQTTNTQISSVQAPFYIMGRNNDINNFLSPHYMRLHSLIMKERDSDKVLRDMIPWVDEKGIPCMWDEISKQYFYNAGTGSFTAGNPI